MIARKYKGPTFNILSSLTIWSVKGGTYYPITVKKHIRAQAIAQENSKMCQLHVKMALNERYDRTSMPLFG